MTGETIKSFLVGLGFSVDDSSLSKFNKSITSATVRVTALSAAVTASATAIFYGIAKISDSFEDLGYELKILAPAINKTLILRQELYKAYSAAGVNLVKVVQSAAKLNLSLDKTKIAIQALYRSTASRFFELLTKQSDIFRQRIYANMPRIQAILERAIKFIFQMLEAVTTLGVRLWSVLQRVYDFFVLLDNATSGWSTKILAVVAAWKLLNLSFLATPLGLILAGLVAILGLFDDFKTWQEGGESIFDWSSFVPVINAVYETLKSVWGVVSSLTIAVYHLFDGLWKLLNLDFSGFWTSMGSSGEKLLDTLESLWGTVKGLWSTLTSIGGWTLQNFGNARGQELGKSINGIPSVSPVGSGVQNSQTNQHVNMQTNVQVHAAADAPSTAKAIGNEVGRQNQIGARLLNSATTPKGTN